VLVAPGLGESRPVYADGDARGVATVIVPPGKKRTLELYYPAPPRPKKGEPVAQFELLWKVRVASNREVAERTPFERLRLAPADYYAGYPLYMGLGLGWGPLWWYDPFYPSVGFYGPIGYRSYPYGWGHRYGWGQPYYPRYHYHAYGPYRGRGH
jgi:hypothetical protein